MKPILILLLLAVVSGSVWGQKPLKLDPDSQLVLTVSQVKEIVRAEIERWWESKNQADTANWRLGFVGILADTTQPEPLKMVIDTVKVKQKTYRSDGHIIADSVWLRIDTLYRLSKEQVEKLR